MFNLDFASAYSTTEWRLPVGNVVDYFLMYFIMPH